MASYRQDMPPVGGYAPFEYAKKNKPRWLKGKWAILGFTVYSGTMLGLHRYIFYHHTRVPELENREAHIAIEPILLAERNRIFLKQLIKNRKDEAEIMKDVPGWIPGTYYGTPIYHDKQTWSWPAYEEYYAHSKYMDGYYKNKMERHNH